MILVVARHDPEEGELLRDAAARGAQQEVVSLLEGSADPDGGPDPRSQLAPMHCASYGGHVEVINALVDANTDANLADRAGGTPLLDAARQAHDQVVRTLLEAKADSNLAGGDGWTPHRWAAGRGHDRVVRSLLEALGRVFPVPGVCRLDVRLLPGAFSPASRLRRPWRPPTR